MSTTTTQAPHEASAWLRGAVARRLRQIDALVDLPEHDVVVAPLRRVGPPGTREDRSCDRCGTYVPPGRDFYPVHVQARHDVLLAGGLCAVCVEREGAR